jgi:hypothetical protein
MGTYHGYCPSTSCSEDGATSRLKARKGVGAQTRWRLQKLGKGSKASYPATYIMDELK